MGALLTNLQAELRDLAGRTSQFLNRTTQTAIEANDAQLIVDVLTGQVAIGREAATRQKSEVSAEGRNPVFAGGEHMQRVTEAEQLIEEWKVVLDLQHQLTDFPAVARIAKHV